jgi:ATP-dependent exoDNAse (exonuclease V) alpha subunit
MAIYHCQVKPVSRGKGQSSTAGAAYRSCSKIFDERTAELHDYTRKRGLEHSEIVLSKEAAKQDIQWARDRHQLWNAAEAAEARKDARVAREYELALPHELTKQQRADLSRAFAQDLANRFQCAVDIAIHKPHRHGDNRNYHAHLYATTRQVTPSGLGEKTWIERSDTDRAKLGLPPGKDEITTIRERWAECTNKALEAANRKERVDHRSLEAQGIDRAPTYHKGAAILGIEARGRKARVVERIEAEEASKRLAKAAEVGRVLEVSRRLRASVIDLESSVGALVRSRETTLGAKTARGQDAAGRSEPTKKLSLEEIQQAAAENWLKYRERAKDKDASPDKRQERDRSLEADRGPYKDKGRAGPDDDFSL